MFLKFNVIVFTALIVSYFYAEAQLVKNRFEYLEHTENFETSNNFWTITSNSDNLFLIQSGEYLLNRKNTVTPYAVISGIQLPSNGYKIVTSLSLQKTSHDKGSIGLLFALQQDKRGGYLLEINNSSQFRIRKLSGSDYVYVTGNEKNKGWEKNAAVYSSGSVNIIELNTADHNYDLYINNILVKSIINKSYSTGNFGFIIGPGSKGSIDFVHIYTSNDDPSQISNKQNINSEDSTGQLLILLEKEVAKLKEENEMLRNNILSVKSEARTIDGEKETLRTQVAMQQNNYNVLQHKNDSLINVNADLEKYKKLFEEYNKGDIADQLSKSLEAERKKNNSLQAANKILNDELNLLKQKTITPSNQQQKSNDFILPK